MEVKGELNTNAPTRWNARRKQLGFKRFFLLYTTLCSVPSENRKDAIRIMRETNGRHLTHFYNLHHSPSLQRYVNAVDKGEGGYLALIGRSNPKFGFLLETVSCNLVGRRWARRRKRTLLLLLLLPSSIGGRNCRRGSHRPINNDDREQVWFSKEKEREGGS